MTIIIIYQYNILAVGESNFFKIFRGLRPPSPLKPERRRQREEHPIQGPLNPVSPRLRHVNVADGRIRAGPGSQYQIKNPGVPAVWRWTPSRLMQVFDALFARLSATAVPPLMHVMGIAGGRILGRTPFFYPKDLLFSVLFLILYMLSARFTAP